MNIIDLTCKKSFKKLTKNLNNGIGFKDKDSDLEIYKPNGSKIYILVNNTSEQTILQSLNLEEIARAYNKQVSLFHKNTKQ